MRVEFYISEWGEELQRIMWNISGVRKIGISTQANEIHMDMKVLIRYTEK